MAKKKSGERKKKPLSRQELQGLLMSQKLQGVASILAIVCPYGVMCYFLYNVTACAEALAGLETVANFSLTGIDTEAVFHWLGTTGAVTYGWVQRDLRKKNIKRMESRVVKSEVDRDPNRSTSGIDTDGNTHPGDKP